ncbi:nucleosome-remodeling factor subunit NURF301 [Aplysia californica]|uniref:Nucleosome-remodeling factor subunit NURF301 n=1 Tax=Aplysia californica TaxID=6500 RepID=A0ABM0JKH8_APLCA|nr:nucleosome-remodeling factor subunit NURF301 [Aplysia californica]
MSTRARRARGRPPKTPLSTNRTNFLRKPKAYQNQEHGINSTGRASPVTHYRSSRTERGRGRAAASRGRHFLSQLIADDDEISSLPEFENDRASDFTDLDNTDHVYDNVGSDASFEGESDQESSDNESLSTVSSSVSRRKVLLKRPKTPDIGDDKDIPALELPSSATDLLLPAEHILQAIGIYEVLRHFRTILRLSPFTFEDFCASLLSDEQSNLQAEIHITLLKALLREEDASNTTFGPQDLKDSINISIYYLDSMTWPEIIRAYLDSEMHPEYRAHLSILESPDFPFVPYAEKLQVLQTLTDLFLAVSKVREEIINEGNIQYDDHCRACHKLGDLLCCETCSAVYHLTCVEPPMQEVPEDDWLCSVCRAHQVKGVTDCVSEAEKSGLLSRQEPIGYDRHARKYWFLCRRIIVESESETRYYSTKFQLEELLESLDPNWEGDLISYVNEMKDDILKQMTFTEELTNSSKGSRKSMMEIENAQLIKVQAERALKKAREEEERKAKEEEEKKKKEEEELKKKEAEENQEEESGSTEKEKEDSDEAEIEKSEVVESESEVTLQTEETASTVKKSSSGDTQTTEIVETTTSTTTVTTVKSTTTTTTKSLSDSENENDDVSDEPPAKVAKLDDETATSKMAGDGDKSTGDSAEKDAGTNTVENSGDKSKEDSKIVLSSKSALAEAIKASSDGKPKVINLQSLLPAARQTLLNVVDKSGEESKNDASTKTVLLVNREGGKVTLQVQRQPVSKEDGSSDSTVTHTTTSTTVNATESRKMLTRSKTGSLTPKLFTDSITMTTSSLKTSGKSSEDVLVMNKDGEVTRVSRGKVSLASSLAHQSVFFKLGAEGSFKQFQNQYTTNTLALNKHQHNEERDKRRHLSHKFSLTQTSEFKWNGNIVGNKMSTLATLRLTITTLEGNVQAPFLHSNWPNHRQNWQKAVQMCQSPRDFALALTILEACIKPCVFNPVWHESLGHLRLNRITVADREEWKKKEKEQRRRKEDEEEVRPVVWIKYTMGLKHQVWKQKGEEYRVTGGNGWQWTSAVRNFKEVPQDTVGLRLVAQRLKNRKVKAAKAASKGSKSSDNDDGAEEEEKMEVEDSSGEGATETEAASETKPDSEQPKVKEEAMDVDESDKVDSDTKSSSMEDGSAEDKSSNAEEKSSTKTEADTEIKMDVGEEQVKDTPRSSRRVSTLPVKKEVKSASLRDQRRQSAVDNFLSFMKEKYLEEKDNVLALELLKQHPPKVDVEVINVCDAIQKRTHYPKVTKPYSKLDNLLERRMKQDEFERKQRMSIETQIALKMKLNQAIDAAKKKKAEEEKKANVVKGDAELVNGEVDDSPLSSKLASTKPQYSCYSVLCRSKDKSVYSRCYSPACQLSKQLEEKSLKPSVSDGSLSKDSVEEDSVGRSSKESTPSETALADDTDRSASPEEKEKGEGMDSFDMEDDSSKKEDDTDKIEMKDEGTSANIGDANTEEEDVDIEGDINKDSASGLKLGLGSSQVKSKSDVNKGTSSGSQTEISSQKESAGASSSPNEKSLDDAPNKGASVSDIVKNLVIKTMAEKAASGKGPALSAQALTVSVEELESRLPPKRSTSDKFKLAKFTRISTKKGARVSKHGRLPMCHKFETPSKKRSVLILDRNELRKIARQGAKRESVMFNYNCKMNNVCWPYPCPRPVFKTAWRFRTMTLQSLSAAALQLRILWACIRWDDMAAKPPAGGTNTVSTETEITTTELLKRREVGVDGLRSEFLVRKIVVPLGVPDKPKEKYTPQRSGLRERKRIEAARQTEPSVTEVWVPEEVLELWEIKQFGEKLEKQRQAAQQEKAVEKTSVVTVQTTVGSQQSAAQIKAQMEQQLKQQRLALAQKRIQENQGIRITTGSSGSVNGATSTTSSSTTIIINNGSQLGKPGTTFKTLTVSSPSSLLSSGIIKTMQPKTIITNASSLLGTQLRPGIRVQIPGSALQLRPQTVTLAPKPGVTTSGVTTATRLISPATSVARVISPSTAQGQTTKTQTIQIKPQSSGQPVQNLHFIQTPNGQLQVRGLLPGQIIQRMPDGKLQIITLSSQAASVNSSPASGQPSIASTPQQQTPRPTLSIRPQQTIMVTIPANSGTTSTPTITQNRLVIPAQLASSVGLSLGQTSAPTTLTVPAVRQVLGSSVVTTPSKQIIMTRPGGPQVISAQNLATVLGSQASQLLPQSSGTPLVSSPAGLNSAVVISAPGVLGAGAQAINAASNVSTVLVNTSQSALLSSLTSQTNMGGPQTIISTLKPLGVTATSTTTTVTTSLATAPAGTSLLAGQVIPGTSLLQRSAGGTSLLNLNAASGSGGTLTISGASATGAQIPKILASPPAGAQIITRPAGSSQPQLVLRPGTSVITGAGQAKVITAQQLRGLTNSPIQLKPAAASSMSPIKSILSPPTNLLPAVSGVKGLTAVRSLTPQLTGQTPPSSSTQQPQIISATAKQVLVTSTTGTSLLPQALTLSTSPEPGSTVASLASPTAGASPSAGAGAPKYAITPQVVEQVVRQALLQNQTPEIQQKLLAMQKQIQQQQQSQPSASATSVVALSAGVSSARRTNQSSAVTTPPTRTVVGTSATSSGGDHSRSKSKGLTQEQKEEQSRVSVCGQVMKTILDRIEREEKQEQRNKKKQESAEEKQKRITALNQQKALYKHKEGLKKEIHRKRSLMEKNLQQEIYNEMAEKLKKAKISVSNTSKSPQGSAAATTVVASSVVTPVSVMTGAGKVAKKLADTPKAPPMSSEAKSAGRKRKQKIISTGVKGLNPKEKLYCVCKTPYDDSKFYIGCDLCSNWFHGACVNISESQANYIDSYICEDCRKQQENTSEELYCLCRTPYDENQFYIGCDRCQDWFHGYCVGISKAEADNIEVYVCPNCQKEESADPIAQKPLTQSEYQHLTKLLKDLQVHKMAWPFLQPVDPREVPDYYDIVAEPMDLTIVEAKLEAKAYHKLNDFVKDVTRIFDNCRLYNPVDTPYFQCAEVVETYFAQKVKALRSANKL